MEAGQRQGVWRLLGVKRWACQAQHASALMPLHPCLPAEEATSTAVGVARPRAQGQATTSTSMASFRLSSSGACAPTASTASEGKVGGAVSHRPSHISRWRCTAVPI